MTTTRGITTVYRGTEYRSRLEARWAAMFHRIGWDAVYEPFDSDGYIPDFVIQGEMPLLIEVKPAVVTAEFFAPVAKVTNGVRGTWSHDILVVGLAPLPIIGNSFDGQQHPSAGLLGEAWPDENGVAWNFDAGLWLLCRNCRSVGVCHDSGSYAARPCGCYDGDGYMGEVGRLALEQHWAAAVNDVKWRGRDA